MREIAKKTYCQNNLSQFGRAVHIYLVHFKGWYPSSGDHMCGRSSRDPSGRPYFPVDLMAHCMGRAPDAPGLIGYLAGFVDPHEVPKVCYCPSTDLDTANSLFDNRDPLRQYWWNGHVDGAGALTGQWKARANLWDVMGGSSTWPDWVREEGTGWVRIVYTKEAVVSRASDLVLMGDTPDHSGRYLEAGTRWMDFAGPTRYGTSAVSRRHLGGSNLLYADGHVDWKHWDYLELERNLRDWLLPVQKDDDVFYVEIP